MKKKLLSTHQAILLIILCLTLLAACNPAEGGDTLLPAASETATNRPQAPSETSPPTLETSPTVTILPTDTPPLPTATVPPPTSTQAPTQTPTRKAKANPTILAGADSYTVVDVTSDDVLNVRSGPGVGNEIIATIPYFGMSVFPTGVVEDISGASWWQVEYENISGWVNSHYLARQVGVVKADVAARVAQVVQSLKQEDFFTLADLVHPKKGVRFSPYTYVSDQDQVLSAFEIHNILADSRAFLWGHYDGTGEPISTSFMAYFARFVYDVDFARPHAVGFNQAIGWGNTINNVEEFYPGAVFVEYHFEGFEQQYAGMDWRSLRLVLERYKGEWYLVGIVHDEWTI